MTGWERAEADEDAARELRRSAPPVHAALLHEGMAVLNRRGEVGVVLRVHEFSVDVRVAGSRQRRWPFASIVEAKAA